ncbi:substrate-binding periplasmic protein [Ectopseudomonas khazarica]|uniref:substrate-binding periplasmic protein n=1 Tax=Ectopseudomonas khazarica TaxID=2502979 RepID=UPI0037C89300
MYRLIWILLLYLEANLAQATCSREITVPFSQQGVDQWLSGEERRGLSVDYLMEVSRRTGCRFEFRNVPRARAWLMFEKGQADLLLGAVHSPERDKFGVFFSQNVLEGVSLVSLKSTPLHLNSSGDILASGLTLTYVRSHDYGPQTAGLIKALDAQGRVILAKDPTAMLRMVKAGRANGAIVLGSAISVEAHRLRLDDKLSGLIIEDLGWTTSGLYLSKDLNPEDHQLLARTFAEMSKEDFYIHLAQDPLRTQPAWVQTSIRLDTQQAMCLVKSNDTTEAFSLSLRARPSR